MWLPKPFYELVPYIYGTLGVAFLTVSWIGTTGLASALLLICGSGLLLISMVLWLRRKDFRDAQQKYNSRSLDET